MRMQSLANYSKENAIGRDATEAFLNEAISEQRLPAFEGRPERYIKGLHEAIIPDSIYWLAHEIIKGRSG